MLAESRILVLRSSTSLWYCRVSPSFATKSAALYSLDSYIVVDTGRDTEEALAHSTADLAAKSTWLLANKTYARQKMALALCSVCD